MAITKKSDLRPPPHQHQELIDKFNEEFSGYSIDIRGARYLAAALRLGDSGAHGVTQQFKIDVMNVLNSKPTWVRATKDDFKRYSSSKKIEENYFDFIGESKYERFFYEMYINDSIIKGFENDLPNGRNLLNNDFSGAKLIFEDVSFSNKEKIIFFYDAWHILSPRKMIDLEQLKSNTHKFLQLTSRCKWFDDKPDGLKAAYDHLKEFDADCRFFSDSDELRIYFLKTYGYNPEKVELSIRKIQMLFHNRKSRATKVKKQVNFSLSEKSIKNIKKLSLTHEENGSKIVDAVFKNDELIRYINIFFEKNRNRQFSENEISGI